MHTGRSTALHNASSHFKPRTTFCLLRTSYYLQFFCCFLLFTTYSLPAPVFAEDAPFTSPSNWGGTGLMEIPTARVMRENSIRFGAGQAKPYRYFYGAISPLKGLEVGGRITELLDVPSGLQNQKNFKDKAFDLKYQFLPEGKYLPALALGIMDPHGTRVFPSQYIVASKQIYPFDFTVGFGNGRFGKKPLPNNPDGFTVELFSDTGDWVRDSQLFWGIQFAPSEKYALMLEYSPIRYHEQTGDPAQKIYFTEPVQSKFNFGIRYKPVDWFEIDLSYQRGDQISVNLSTAFDIGDPLIPIYNPVYQAQPGERRNPVHNRIITALHRSGFSDIFLLMDNGDLWVEAENDKYFYNTMAVSIILRILNNTLTEDTEKVHIALKKNGIPMLQFVTSGKDISDLYAENLTLSEFLYVSQFNTGPSAPLKKKGAHRKAFRYGYKPSIETFLNDPSGFFKYRIGVSGWMSYSLWPGGSLATAVSTFPLNNIETSNDPLSIPVRSDIVFYMKKKLVLSRLLVDQIKKFSPNLYGRLSAGILEIEYAGIDAEVATPVLDGRVLLGLSGSAVKKRDPDNPFSLKENDVKDHYTTAFFNVRLNIPELEASFDIKAGQFLAGDDGVRYTLTKNIKGVKIWAWYTVTDTSIFSDSFNSGYHDKGIGISIPLRMFKGTDSRTSYSYSLSPWTRDTGQDIAHYNPLFDFIGRNLKIYLDKDKKIM